jgi:PAS domain S-box-containing protein
MSSIINRPSIPQTADLFRTIFNVSNEAILVHDVHSGAILNSNKRFRDMFGFSESESLDITIEDLCSEEAEFTAANAQQKLAYANQHGALIFQWLARHQTGKSFWVEIDLKRVELSGCPYIIAFIHDISELKLADQSLVESEEKWRVLAEIVPDIIMMLDRNGRIFFTNHLLQGYEHHEIIGASIFDFQLPEFVAPLEKQIQQVFELKQAISFDHVVIHKPDQQRYYSSRITPVKDDQEVVAALVISTDVTEQKHAQEELKGRNSSLAAIKKIADRVYGARDIVSVAKEAVEAMSRYTSSTSISFFLLNTQHHTLDLVYSSNSSFADKQGMSVQLNDSLGGITIAQKSVICSANIKYDKRFNQNTKHWLLEEGHQAAVSVPLLFKDEALGVINIFFNSAHSVSDIEKQTLQSIGKTIGMAVANAHYVSQLHQEMQDRRQAEETLRNIAIGVSAATGNDFFRSLVKKIANTFDLNYALLGQFKRHRDDVIKTIAVHNKDSISGNFTFNLKDTPCEKVIRDGVCIVPHSVQQRFPNDKMLEELEAQSFMGVALHDSMGETSGLFVAIDSNPITNPALVISMLRIFAVRAAAEFERLHAERALRHNEEHLRLAIAASSIATWEWDIKNDRLAWSSNFYSLFHLRPTDIVNSLDEYLNLVMKEDQPHFRESLQTSLHKNKTYQLEHRIVVENNDIRWVSFRGEIYRNTDNKPTLMRGTVSDITQQKQAESQLLASQKMLQLVLHHIPTRVFWKDRNLHYLGCNQSFANDAGLDNPAQVIGKNDSDMPWSEKAESIRKDDLQVMTSGVPKLNYEEQHTLNNGKTGWLETSKIPLTDIQGNIIGVLSTYNDITPRIEAKKELKKYREHLEELVEKRTNELTRVNQELEAFSYSVSHDLRAPLRAIDGFSLALIEDHYEKLNEDAKDYLQRVRNAAQRMSRLIDDLLKLSRLTRGKLNRVDVNISKIASEITTKLQLESPHRLVEFRIESDLYTQGDEGLLRVVLENLFSNAWKYSSKEKKAIVQFNCQEFCEETVYCVEDNGVGFNMEYVDKLFGAFQRLHRNDEFEGSGIGLATVARIVHRHGGRVWAHGEEGQGARFYFSLPKTSES